MNKPQSFCRHTETVWTTVGGRYFSGGEVWDDFCDICVCLDCGQIVADGGFSAEIYCPDYGDDPRAKFYRPKPRGV